MKLETLKKENARLNFEVDNLKATIIAMERTIIRLSADINEIETTLKKELCYECKEILLGA